MVVPHLPPQPAYIKKKKKGSCIQTDERFTCYSSLNVQSDSPPSSALCIDTESLWLQNKLCRVCHSFFHQNIVEYSQLLIPTTAPTCVQSVNHKLG